MRYLFGEYILDTNRHELMCGDDLVKLRPKVFRVLSYLVVHHDRMVPKAELLDEIWPRSVGEEVLNSCVMAARRAVGDDGRNQDIIKTTHGLGFRFAASVHESPDEEATGGETEQSTKPVEAELAAAVEMQHERKPAGSALPADATSHIATEYKIVTVLACAIKSAEDLADQLGLEVTHELMEAFFADTRAVMARYGGSVIQWLGDGFVALFGAPVAHEDDPRRAALAALELCAKLNDQYQQYAISKVGTDHRPSIGLHTGPVIVGSLGNIQGLQTYTARGKTTDLAVQLQRQAVAGSVLVSEDTFQLVEGEVEVEPQPVDPTMPRVYRLLEISKRHAGVPRRSGNTSGRFVGRREELSLLQERLSRAVSKNGHVVSISGAAGIGKSRLVSEFCSSIPDGTARILRGQCLPYGSSTPYLPIADIIRELIGVGGNNEEMQIRQTVQAVFADKAMPPESESLLLDLFGVSVDQKMFRHLSPHVRRMQTFELLREMLFDAARTRALVIVVEDLHWVDATSEVWLDKFFSRLNDAGILVVLTYRPSYRPDWLGRASATQLSLPPLTDNDSGNLVRSIRDEISEDIAGVLVSRAAGNPFFLEELTRSLGTNLDEQSLGPIPNSVQAVLASRIDRLEFRNKQLLQSCSVIGTPVFYDLLRHLLEFEPDGLDPDLDPDLEVALGELEEMGFLFEMRGTSQRSFRFKHVLTQDATYRSLPQKTLVKLHSQIADILERHFNHIVESQPEVLAQHHKKAGNVEAGVRYWQRAARQAYEKSANVEAIGYASEGLELLEEDSGNGKRDEIELSFQLTLAPALMAVKGYGANEVEPVYLRARALCEQVGDSRRLFRALIGLWNFYWVRGELDVTRDVAQQLLDLAVEADDPERKLRAHGAMGEFLFHAGELEEARFHLTQSIALYESSPQPSLATKIPEVVSLCYASWTLWHTGDSDQSLVHASRAVALARELAHPMSLALCLNLIAELHQFRLEVQDCLVAASDAVSLSQTHGLPFWEGTGMINLGWAQAMDGNLDEGRKRVEDGLEMFSSTGARVQMPTWLGMLAEVHCHSKRFDEGLSAVREGLKWVGCTGERHYQSELHRVEGELLRYCDVDGNAKAAENAFTLAISTAREQGAIVREVRARTSLAQLLLDQGRDEAVKKLIDPQRQWLRDAVDGVDVRQARAVFDTLR